MLFIKEKILIMEHQKALFIVPPTGLFYRDDRCQVSLHGVSNAIRPPLDLAYMTSILEEHGHECWLRDYPVERNSWDAFKADVKELAPTMVVIYTTITSVKDDLLACNMAKEIDPDIVTIAKGGDTTLQPIERLEMCADLDIAIVGEPELTILDIAQNMELKDIKGICYREDGKITRTPERPYIEDLDILPFPSRHLIDQTKYLRPDNGELQTTIQTSRGCPAQCIYCLSSAVSGSAMRLRSPKNVVDELEHCVKEHNIKNFFFRAETFSWDKEWVIEVCKGIIDRKLDIEWVANNRVSSIDEERLQWMKKAGCWLVSFGIESGNQRILDLTKKGITLEQGRRAVKLAKKLELKTFLTFIIGMPWETKETINDTFNFAKELDGDFFEVILPFPFPGTEYYDIAKRDGLIMEGAFDKTYDHFNSVVKTYTLSADDLTALKKKSFWTLYARPKYVKKILSQCDSPKAFKNYLSFGFNKMKAHFATSSS